MPSDTPAPFAPSDAHDASARSLGRADLASLLEAKGLDARIVEPGAPTPTVDAAAAALGVPVSCILKSLVFCVDAATAAEPFVLVIAAGPARIDADRLALALGVDPDDVALARPEAVSAATGYDVGAMPPFGHRRPLPTWIDAESVPTQGRVYGGGGSRHAMLEFSADILETVTAGRRVPLTTPG